MPRRLGYELHKLTARLDRFADGLLREAAGVSYARFLALFAVRECGGTQRDIRLIFDADDRTGRQRRAVDDDRWNSGADEYGKKYRDHTPSASR